MTKESYPAAKVTGVDVDRKILNNAIQKVKERKLDIFLLDYDGVHLPFQSKAFDRILSCLVFHHLDTEAKKKVLAETFRVLSNNGELFIADFGLSKSWLQRILFNIIRGLDGYKPTDANAKGLLPQLMEEAGFENVFIQKRFRTVFGEIQIISGEKIFSK